MNCAEVGFIRNPQTKATTVQHKNTLSIGVNVISLNSPRNETRAKPTSNNRRKKCRCRPKSSIPWPSGKNAAVISRGITARDLGRRQVNMLITTMNTSPMPETASESPVVSFIQPGSAESRRFGANRAGGGINIVAIKSLIPGFAAPFSSATVGGQIKLACAPWPVRCRRSKAIYAIWRPAPSLK